MARVGSWLTAAFLVLLLVAGTATAAEEVVQKDSYIGWGAMRKGGACAGNGEGCRSTPKPVNPYTRPCTPYYRCRGNPPAAEGGKHWRSRAADSQWLREGSIAWLSLALPLSVYLSISVLLSLQFLVTFFRFSSSFRETGGDAHLQIWVLSVFPTFPTLQFNNDRDPIVLTLRRSEPFHRNLQYVRHCRVLCACNVRLSLSLAPHLFLYLSIDDAHTTKKRRFLSWLLSNLKPKFGISTRFFNERHYWLSLDIYANILR